LSRITGKLLILNSMHNLIIGSGVVSEYLSRRGPSLSVSFRDFRLPQLRNDLAKNAKFDKVIFLPTYKNNIREELDILVYRLVESVDFILSSLKFNMLVFVSSRARYGAQSTLLTATEASDRYAKEKIEVENYIFEKASSSCSSVAILRPSSIFGDSRLNSLIEIIKYRRKSVLNILGIGEQLRDFAYIKEFANFTYALSPSIRFYETDFFTTMPISVNSLLHYCVGDEMKVVYDRSSDVIDNHGYWHLSDLKEGTQFLLSYIEGDHH
jgi:hypothetical protein